MHKQCNFLNIFDENVSWDLQEYDKMLDHTTIENLKVCHQQYSQY